MSGYEIDDKFLAQATCLTNYEAAQKLASSSESQKQIVGNALGYAQEFSQINNDTDLATLKTYLQESFKDYEIVTLINLLPSTPAEAKNFCPSLVTKSDEELADAINKIYRIISM